MSDYLRQVIVVDKSLCMPSGKLAAMVAHASMTFITSKLRPKGMHPLSDGSGKHFAAAYFTKDQAQWLTELEPGLEEQNQLSFAKIVCQVHSEAELLQVEEKAKAAGLECHRVVDGGHSHNKPNTLACIAIGPDWPTRLQPVTGSLKAYR